jgi:hypothetical protein
VYLGGFDSESEAAMAYDLAGEGVGEHLRLCLLCLRLVAGPDSGCCKQNWKPCSCPNAKRLKAAPSWMLNTCCAAPCPALCPCSGQVPRQQRADQLQPDQLHRRAARSTPGAAAVVTGKPTWSKLLWGGAVAHMRYHMLTRLHLQLAS